MWKEALDIEKEINCDSENVMIFRAPKKCKIESLNCKTIGNVMVELGAGRKNVTDLVDSRISMKFLAAPNQILE
jgi:thymidine phosphorylase